ncbi:MAG: aminotransferase class V-fold PLP-dependent enzyme, partial [Gemmatimonadales bacterium]
APEAPPAAAKPRMPAAIGVRDDEKFWKELRKEFSIPKDEVFFNTGTMGSSPLVVQDAVIDHMRHVDRDVAHWDYKGDHEQYFTGYFPERRFRDKLGLVLNCDGHDVALCQNATFGMNFVAHGLTFAAGDEVIVTNQAHPGGRKGYDLRAKRDGIVVKEVVVPDPVPSPDELIKGFLDLTTPKTKVWAIPHISSGRAIKYPVEKLCALARERNIFTAVDGAQCLGHLAIDVQAMGCDAYFGSPHKWLLAPKGTGFLYVRPDRQKGLWATLASSAWDDQNDRMFALMQYGTGNLSLLVGLEKAIDFHLQLGPKRVEARITGLADRLRTALQTVPGITFGSPLHPELTCASTVYGLHGATGDQIQDFLWDHGKIRVRSEGPIGVRHCCHIYNLPENVDHAVALLRAMPRT